MMVRRPRPSRVVRASGLASSLRAVASSSDVAFRSATGTSCTALERVDEGRPVGPVEKKADPGPGDAHEQRHDDRRGQRDRKGASARMRTPEIDRDRHADALDGGLHGQPGALRQHLVDRVDGGPRRAIGQGNVGDAGGRDDPQEPQRGTAGGCADRDHRRREQRQHDRVRGDARPQAEAAAGGPARRTRKPMLAAFIAAV